MERRKRGFSESEVAQRLRFDVGYIKRIEAEPIKIALKDLYKVIRLYNFPEDVVRSIQLGR